MAEEPRFYLPKWSQMIMDEVTRNLIGKWGMAPERARRREQELRKHFPDPWVEGCEPIIPAMTNDPGDRHVMAAAVRSQAELIVTYNRRHFPAATLQTWEIDVEGPSAFLRGQDDLDALLITGKLSFDKNVPGFVNCFCEEQGIDLAGGGPAHRGE